MISSEYVQIDSLLLNLFQELRKAGMALTLEQYELLQKAVAQGYGLGGWEDLKRVCRLLWVKPSANYDGDTFERAFDAFKKDNIRQHGAKMDREPEEKPPEDPPPIVKPTALPQIPPRRTPKKTGTPSATASDENNTEVPTAVKTNSNPLEKGFTKDTSKEYILTPKNFPIKLQDVRDTWKFLKRPVPIGKEYELDIEATIDLIEREGLFSDVVMRPVKVRRAELLLLIDDNLAMIPFFGALQPFTQAIDEARITPARIYRFTSYPDEYLYQWHHPTKAELITNLLSKLHKNRTIALILSDAGAATGTYSEERIQGIWKFLHKLSPCVRQLIWLNPLPSKRWQHTSAWEIHKILDGKMLTYESASLQTVVKQNSQGSMIQICQIPHL
ncbi:hypothetical protein DSM106972_026980 [Dulcicalothrix desertica PCC 7102]|uniref:VWA containing CoxE family protein n=1 Tax=Dulcicalothrix desertica PCC 7102 TaxID=232991 RepID=A0A433VK38_9CYAN|nr:hypothetical protein [Dulcicalothrix desertica]RUT06441.1 hypothetical protein DSM106972_026980 [Dulcicalothrix desertica PCC 7102]TWH50415.1 hypothetical protein CAL7102_04717 [Dulcicalothrix desertica PCC 7102]